VLTENVIRAQDDRTNTPPFSVLMTTKNLGKYCLSRAWVQSKLARYFDSNRKQHIYEYI
jgi:hypothetical protein